MEQSRDDCTVFNVYNNTDLSTILSQVNNLKTHLILEIAHFDQLPQEAISQCLQAKSDLNKRLLSLVLVVNENAIFDLPDTLSVAPTLLEAYDVVDLEVMERDLGF